MRQGRVEFAVSWLYLLLGNCDSNEVRIPRKTLVPSKTAWKNRLHFQQRQCTSWQGDSLMETLVIERHEAKTRQEKRAHRLRFERFAGVAVPPRDLSVTRAPTGVEDVAVVPVDFRLP